MGQRPRLPIFASGASVRQAVKATLEPGSPGTERLGFDPKSRDDIPKLLRDLQMSNGSDLATFEKVRNPGIGSTQAHPIF